MKMNQSQKFKILSIDGGGIRGIIPGKILIAIEEMLNELHGENHKIGHYFDMIAGTSTGGILTALYLMPDDKGNYRYSAQDAIDLYLKYGEQIFSRSFFQKLRSLFGLIEEKYSAKNLEMGLQSFMGSTELKQLLKPCLITSYEISQRTEYFFNSIDAQKDSDYNYYLKDVARATSAAQIFFELAQIKSLAGSELHLIDGGMVANNPALCAYAEARHAFNTKYKAADIVMLSLGTGKNLQPYNYKKARNWGLAKWLSPVISILMSSSSNTVDFQLRQLFDAAGVPEQYFRIECQLSDENTAMDNASELNRQALQNAAEIALRQNESAIRGFIEKYFNKHSD